MREEMEERIIEEIGQESQSEQASQSEIVETQKETVSEADNKEKNKRPAWKEVLSWCLTLLAAFVLALALKNYVIIVVWILGFFLFGVFKTSLFCNIAEPLYYPVRALLSLAIIITVIAFFEFFKSKMETFHGILVMVFSWFGSVTLELYLLHQSYMILFDFPYKALYYCIVAFGLPTITAVLITIYRKEKVRK